MCVCIDAVWSYRENWIAKQMDERRVHGLRKRQDQASWAWMLKHLFKKGRKGNI